MPQTLCVPGHIAYGSVIAGQGFSAVAGLLVVHLLGPSLLSGALAVALAIAAMHSLRCIHPPGGATAFAAVLGGPAMLIGLGGGISLLTRRRRSIID